MADTGSMAGRHVLVPRADIGRDVIAEGLRMVARRSLGRRISNHPRRRTTRTTTTAYRMLLDDGSVSDVQPICGSPISHRSMAKSRRSICFLAPSWQRSARHFGSRPPTWHQRDRSARSVDYRRLGRCHRGARVSAHAQDRLTARPTSRGLGRPLTMCWHTSTVTRNAVFRLNPSSGVPVYVQLMEQ